MKGAGICDRKLVSEKRLQERCECVTFPRNNYRKGADALRFQGAQNVNLSRGAGGRGFQGAITGKVRVRQVSKELLTSAEVREEKISNTLKTISCFPKC